MSGPRTSIPRRLRSAFSEPGVRFSLIWQVFLVYPVLAVLSADSATPWTVLGLASVAAFAVVYLASFASPAITEGFPLHLRGGLGEVWSGASDGDDRASLGLGYLIALLACAAGTAPAAGVHGVVTFLPFLSCFVTSVWGLRRSMPSVIALVAVGVGAAFAVDQMELLIPALLVVPISASMVATRLAIGAGERETRYRRALGVSEERERLGRDLHDVLGHTLTALAIRAQLADALVEKDPGEARREIRNIEELTRTALSEMRQTVAGMRATDPAEEMVRAEESLRSAGMNVEVTGDPGRVPFQHGPLVAWTIREAATNIIRHSGAENASIEFGPGGVRVVDDGIGCEPTRAPDGQGLRGLARRAEDEGATFGVSRPETSAGTIVEVGWG